MAKKRLRDIVVLLPGILGSVLQKDGTDIWALSGQAAWNSLTSFGDALQGLLLQDDDHTVDDLGDGIQATRLMPDVHFVPGLVKIDGYTAIVHLIENSFQVRPGNRFDHRPANFIEFPYDWRRDNRVAARQLKQLIDRQLPLWRESSGAEDAKVIVVAHSMGGIIARYYLEVLEGWRDCRALITFGTPYRGSLNALNFLANGYKQLFVDLTEVMRSFTSVYQLLPIYEAVQIDRSYQRVAEIEGVPGIVRARAQHSLAFHRAIENAVNEHRKDIAYLQDSYTILPIVGTHQPTYQSAALIGGRLTVERALPATIDALLSDGDGTVPMLSAIPIELSEKYHDTFFPERHGSLQRNTAVLKHLRGRLERMQIRGLPTARGPDEAPEAAEQPAISLDVEDLYVTGEPVELRAQLLNVSEQVRAEPPEAMIEPVDARGASMKKPFQIEGDSWVLRLDGIPAGLYRLEVRTPRAGVDAPPAVHDLFEVAQ
jgi:pimeloyl-ACP methyl ester carboxylesterase